MATSGREPRYIVSPADEAILRALFRYYYLTNTRITRLLYAAGSASLVRARLKRLADSGYCLQLFLPRPSRGGSAPIVYRLSRKGLNLLAAHGAEIPARYRLIEEREHSYLFYSHTLACNDFLIGAELLARAMPQIGLTRLVHERDLKRLPATVAMPDGSMEAYMADGWLELRVDTNDGRFQECLLLELDQGTMGQSRWRRKVAKIIGFSEQCYEREFGTSALTVAVVTTQGEKRRDDLLAWTEGELEAGGRPGDADLFRFTALRPETEPDILFRSPSWQRPFDSVSLPLVSPNHQLLEQSPNPEGGDVWPVA
jgi:Replication-relaxation